MICEPLGTGYRSVKIVLYRRGWPTSIVLLFLVVVTELSLSLGCHPPLCLHHLFGLISTTRGLVSLTGIKVLQI
jgi:hypothetical protein